MPRPRPLRAQAHRGRLRRRAGRGRGRARSRARCPTVAAAPQARDGARRSRAGRREATPRQQPRLRVPRRSGRHRSRPQRCGRRRGATTRGRRLVSLASVGAAPRGNRARPGAASTSMRLSASAGTDVPASSHSLSPDPLARAGRGHTVRRRRDQRARPRLEHGRTTTPARRQPRWCHFRLWRTSKQRARR